MAFGRKTGGRQKGTRNVKTVEREAAMAEAAKRLLASDDGEGKFDGDAHALLRAIYTDPAFPVSLRADAAKAALRNETPEDSSAPKYVACMPLGVKDLDEWRRLYMEAKPDASPEDVAWHEKLAKDLAEDTKVDLPWIDEGNGHAQ